MVVTEREVIGSENVNEFRGCGTSSIILALGSPDDANRWGIKVNCELRQLYSAVRNTHLSKNNERSSFFLSTSACSVLPLPPLDSNNIQNLFYAFT